MEVTRTYGQSWHVYYLTPKRVNRLYFNGDNWHDILQRFEEFITEHVKDEQAAIIKVTRNYTDTNHQGLTVGHGETTVVDMMASGDPDNNEAYQEIVRLVDLSRRIHDRVATAANELEVQATGIDDEVIHTQEDEPKKIGWVKVTYNDGNTKVFKADDPILKLIMGVV